MAIRNKSTIPSGMLAPSGLVEGFVNPGVQSTARPAGALLQPSPGYDSIRRGKNRFQGKGPSGGFRMQEFAEDVGGTGAALSVVPGMTTSLEASEWLPEAADSIPEGSIIIADRKHEPGYAEELHEAYNTLPDMGDRHPDRPRTMSQWLVNPVGLWRKDYREHPAITILASVGLVMLINMVARDVESSIGGYRPRSLGSAVTEPPAAAARVAGGTADDVAKATSNAVDQIGKVTDEAVNKIGNAADNAVNKIESTVTGS